MAGSFRTAIAGRIKGEGTGGGWMEQGSKKLCVIQKRRTAQNIKRKKETLTQKILNRGCWSEGKKKSLEEGEDHCQLLTRREGRKSVNSDSL